MGKNLILNDERGMPHGICKFHFDNGRKKIHGTYKHGEPYGLWKRWTYKGRLMFEYNCIGRDKEGEEITYE
jgi:antitoxin component YwqK of YwqJK toxin-antitoxin module